MKSRSNIYIITAVLLFVILFFLDIVLGSENVSLSDMYAVLFYSDSANQVLKTIIFDFRIPKAITAVLAGFALSVSGMQMQTVFRNPLAGPYILGISSGAGLGVAVVILGMTGMAGNLYFQLFRDWAVIFAACFGAGLTLLLIMIISTRVKDVMTILIIGILIGAVSSAIINILQYFSNASLLKTYVLWTFGSLGKVTGKELLYLIPVIFIGLIISITQLKNLNALLLGDDYARTMGVNTKRSRIWIYISTSTLAGSITAFCGPVAFIGIISPHIARMIFNTSNHFKLFWTVLLTGSIIMLIADIVSHIPGSDIILPLNAINSLLGIPIVIWMVIKNNKISSGF